MLVRGPTGGSSPPGEFHGSGSGQSLRWWWRHRPAPDPSFHGRYPAPHRTVSFALVGLATWISSRFGDHVPRSTRAPEGGLRGEDLRKGSGPCSPVGGRVMLELRAESSLTMKADGLRLICLTLAAGTRVTLYADQEDRRSWSPEGKGEQDRGRDARDHPFRSRTSPQERNGQEVPYQDGRPESTVWE